MVFCCFRNEPHVPVSLCRIRRHLYISTYSNSIYLRAIWMGGRCYDECDYYYCCSGYVMVSFLFSIQKEAVF